MKLGAHESISGGVYKAIERAVEDTCESLQIFTKNANQWKAKALTQKEIDLFKKAREESGIGPVVAHDSYLINLCATDPDKLQKSRDAFVIELDRAQALGLDCLVTHPGSHLGAGEAAAIELMIESLDLVIDRAQLETTKIALETTAGQGTNLGWKFEHLRDLIGGVKHPEMFVICFDTAHALAAGYDHRTPEGYAKVFEDFDRIIGLEKLAVFHLNDSKKDLGTRVDRHDQIGEGFIGTGTFAMLVNDARFAELPGILETPALPDKTSSYAQNLNTLRGLIGKQGRG